MSNGGASRATVDHPERKLVPLAEGGFEFAAAGEAPVRAVPHGDGWRMESGGALNGARLERQAADGGGFILAAGSEELARTASLVGVGREAGLRFVLLDDGRLFRIVMRGPRRVGFDLLGWETPGAYLSAQPTEDGGWALAPTAAAGGIVDLTVLLVTLSAEILEAEGSLLPQVTP